MRDVEDDGVRAAGPVLVEAARVLDRHLPAAERGEPRAERPMFGVEGTVLEHVRHRGGAYAAFRPSPPPCLRSDRDEGRVAPSRRVARRRAATAARART